ncbi:MAG: hypothetical protein HC853_10160 [Anaerolineae bacterium]|nr:hypothetical protein [Anaerolineae bacterium]
MLFVISTLVGFYAKLIFLTTAFQQNSNEWPPDTVEEFVSITVVILGIMFTLRLIRRKRHQESRTPVQRGGAHAIADLLKTIPLSAAPSAPIPENIRLSAEAPTEVKVFQSFSITVKIKRPDVNESAIKLEDSKTRKVYDDDGVVFPQGNIATYRVSIYADKCYVFSEQRYVFDIDIRQKGRQCNFMLCAYDNGEVNVQIDASQVLSSNEPKLLASTNLKVTAIIEVKNSTVSEVETASSEPEVLDQLQISLVKELNERFNKNELEQLCNSIQGEWENLEGDSKAQTVLHIVQHCRRRDKLPLLIRAMAALRNVA